MDFWDIFQQAQIGRAESRASTAQFSADSAQIRIDRLEQKVDALSLACMAMWEFLAREQGLTIVELERKIEEIDLRDGIRDGKLNPYATKCKACGHRLNPKRSDCFYCGEKLVKAGPF